MRALADFDAATIATTHGFCQEVLSGIGVAGDMEPDAEVVEDVGDLLDEVVDDLYVRKYMDPATRRSRARRRCRSRARSSATRGSPIEPRDVSGSGLPGAARAAGRRRAGGARPAQARASVITYDDLLTRLRDELAGRRGPQAVERLRARYRVVLVDEFQDTDPIQWEILQRAFGAGGVTLVLIGDPKQAIYAFRGADVYSYLEAKAARARRTTLEVNRRSDQELIDAYDAMFGGAKLGHPEIVYGRVARAASANRSPSPGAPLRVRVVDRSDPPIDKTRQGYAGLNSARDVRRARSGGGPRPRARRRGGPARRRRGPRPLQPPRGGRPRCARRRRHPVRHQRRGQRVLHARGARVAAAARGAGASGVTRPGPRRDHDLVPRLDRGAGRLRRATTSGRRSTAACTRGPRSCAGAGWRRCRRRSRWSSDCRAACSAWSTASAA